MQNYALLRESTGIARLQPTKIPTLRDDYILVRTVAVAVNPTDYTTLDAPGDNGTIVGCDYAGIVEEVGSAVTKAFKRGDRIAGFAHGANDANYENGAFARYIAVKGDIQMHIPDKVSFEEAAGVGVGIGTTGYALYRVLGLTLPPAKSDGTGKTALIYGGSTATGSVAIQFAKLSGWNVITTSSPQHFDWLKKLGADEVFDYRDPNVGQVLNTAISNTLTHAFDCVSTEPTAAICAAAISTRSDVGSKIYCSLLGPEIARDDVKSTFFLAYCMSGEAYIFEGESFSAAPQDYEFAKEWYSITEKLWAEGKWKPHPQQIEKGGLGGLVEGMQRMKEGKVRGVKLVYRVEETVWPEA